MRIYNSRVKGTIVQVAAAVHRFESYTRFRDFHDFHIEQAKAFKSRLAKESNAWTGEKLSAATITSILGTLKDMEDMVRLIARAGIEPDIGVVLPMEQAEEGFRTMWEGRTRGKTVFTR